MEDKTEYKIFVSVPMAGKTNEEIREYQKFLLDDFVKSMCEECQSDVKFILIDSFIEEEPPENASNDGAWYLGRSLVKLAEADHVLFAPGWKDARGCRIEFEVCVMYDIPCTTAY